MRITKKATNGKKVQKNYYQNISFANLNGKLEFENQVNVTGSRPKYKCIPINTRPINGQRTVDAKTIKKWVKAEGGVNLSLMSPPMAAVWHCLEKNDDHYAVFDGGHRTVLEKLADPLVKTMPALVVRVKDEAEANRLFAKINASRRKAVVKEDVFVNNYLGEEPKATDFGPLMQKLGIQVVGTNGNRVPALQADGPSVKVNSVEFSTKTDSAAYEAAILKIQALFQGAESLPHYLVMGLSRLYEKYPDLIQNNNNPTPWSMFFNQWLSRKAGDFDNLEDMSATVYADSEQIKGSTDWVMAKQMMTEFRKTKFFNNSLSANSKLQRALSLSKLDKEIKKKKKKKK